MIDHPEGTPLEVTLETARQMKQYLATRARGPQPAALRRQRRPLQLQRPRAPLLPAPLAPVGGPPGEPRAQGRARRAEPRHRQARAPGPRRDREAARRARQGRRDPARAARSWTRWWPRSTGRPRRCAATSRRHVRGLFETTDGVVDVHDSMEAERDRVAREPRPREGRAEGHPRDGRGRDARRPRRRPRRRPHRRPALARAGAGPRPALRRGPREPRAAARRCASTRRWAARSRSATSRTSSACPSRSRSSARTSSRSST